MNLSKVLLMQYIILAFLFLFDVILGSRVSEIKKNLESSVKSKVEKVKSQLNPGDTVTFQKPETEFPGNDLDLVKQIRYSWDKYYDCLNAQNENLGVHKSVMPEAIMKFEGSAVQLECKVCLSPVDELNEDAVVWNYRTLVAAENDTREVEFNDRLFRTMHGKALHIFNLMPEDSGQYLCQIGPTVTAPYILEVDDKEKVLVVKPDTAPNGKRKQPPIASNKIFVIFTNYYGWSPCSRCDMVGKRVRHGMCTAILSWNYAKYHPDEPEPAATDASNDLSHTTARKTRHVLNIFRKGVPCRSQLLPEAFRAAFSDRKSEIMKGLCNVSCVHSEVFEVLDVDGQVVEVANNTAGVYSTLQGIPPLRPAVRRRTLFHGTDVGEIVVKCPGSLNSEMPVHWQIGETEISPRMIKKQTNGRIHINAREQIVIKKPQIADSNIYSCWQSRDLAGTVRLNVFKVHEMNAGQGFVVFTMVLVMGTFLLVFCRAFKGRKRQLAR